MPEFYMIFARKIFFPEFWGASALPAPCLLYAYVRKLRCIRPYLDSLLPYSTSTVHSKLDYFGVM